jgi:hypothetical protein
MTPDSVLKAMAEALAEKYTTDGLDQPMVKVHPNPAGAGIEAPSPRQAAVEVMDSVVGPLLDLVWEMKGLLEEAGTMLRGLEDQAEEFDQPHVWALRDEITKLVVTKVEMDEPADWDYVRRFSATPNEIHDILRSGLHPNVLKAYVDAVKAGEFDPQG